MNEATRRLAAHLRELPHENVGIITDPATASPGGAAPVRTLGTVVIALLNRSWRALDLVQQESRACPNRRFTIIGPNETQLDCDGSLSSATLTAWLNGVMKG